MGMAASEQGLTPEERVKQLEAQLEYTHTHYQKLFEQVPRFCTNKWRHATIVASVKCHFICEPHSFSAHTCKQVSLKAIGDFFDKLHLNWQVDGAAVLSDVEHVPHARPSGQHEAAVIHDAQVWRLLTWRC